MKFVVTGAHGLLGWHASARIHASNCAARFRSEALPFDLVRLGHTEFLDDDFLADAVADADAVLHFAGINRAPDDEIERGNPEIANRLLSACRRSGSKPHIVYANSTHAGSDSPYGRSKRKAGELLSSLSSRYTDLILPHIFGETARPNYNNVTATFIDAVINGKSPDINKDGRVSLLHAGAAVEYAIKSVLQGRFGTVVPESRTVAVPDLLKKLQGFHLLYGANTFPDFKDRFDLDLFNSYRAALYPDGFPRSLALNTDERGTLFEAAKGGGGGQTFLSWTVPGVSRGDHFHLSKVERFLVLQGEAVIRIRRVLDDRIWEFKVKGDVPSPVDMPTLHTHSIENIGAEPLLTLFWTHEIFDRNAPDTYADPVLKG